MATSQHENPCVVELREQYREACADNVAGRCAAAEEKLRHLIPLQQRMCGTEQADTINSRAAHASSLQLLGRYSEAENIFRDVLQIKQQSPEFGLEHPGTLVSVTQLGNCLLAQQRYKEAEPMLRKVHATHVRVLGPLAQETLSIQVNLGRCLTEDNQPEEAEGLLRGAWEGYQKSGLRVLPYPKALIELVKCLNTAGKHAEAEPLCRQAVQLAQHILGERHRLAISAMALHGVVLGALGRYAEAEPVCRQAVKLARHTLGEQHELTLQAMVMHGEVLESSGRHAEAGVMFNLALQASRAMYGFTDSQTLGVVHRLANCMATQGKAQPMEDLLRDTLSRVQQALGEGHTTTIVWMRHLGRLLQQSGRDKEGKVLLRRAKELARANKCEHNG